MPTLLTVRGLSLAMVLAAMAGPGLAQDSKPLKLNTTADHTKFKELQRSFESGPEVTQACLQCHTEAAGQIHRTVRADRILTTRAD